MEKHDGHQKLNKPINRATVSETVNHLFAMIPDCAVASYCGLKILAATLVSRFCSSTYLVSERKPGFL
jgi:hypothetical protein